MCRVHSWGKENLVTKSSTRFLPGIPSTPLLKLRVRTSQEAETQKEITFSNPSDLGATLVPGSVISSLAA